MRGADMWEAVACRGCFLPQLTAIILAVWRGDAQRGAGGLPNGAGQRGVWLGIELGHGRHAFTTRIGEYLLGPGVPSERPTRGQHRRDRRMQLREVDLIHDGLGMC